MTTQTIHVPAKIFDGESYLDLLKFHNAQDLSNKAVSELELAGKLDLKITLLWPYYRRTPEAWSWPETIDNRMGPIPFNLFEEFDDLYQQTVIFINEYLANKEEALAETKPTLYPSPHVLDEQFYKK